MYSLINNNDLQLTNRQYEVLNGSLLGDGYLRKNKNIHRNSYFEEEHSSKQREWLKWKQNELSSLLSTIHDRIRPARKHLGKDIVNDSSRHYYSSILETKSHPILTALEQSWYKRNHDESYCLDSKGRRIKQVPIDLVLTPLIIAVWFMDDGHNHQSHRCCKIHTQAFSIDEVDRLIKQINAFGINAKRIREKQKNGMYKPLIYVPVSSYELFLNFVSKELPDIPECMKYKLDTSLVNTLRLERNKKCRETRYNNNKILQMKT